MLCCLPYAVFVVVVVMVVVVVVVAGPQIFIIPEHAFGCSAIGSTYVVYMSCSADS